jgi:hypothetical protein
MSVQLAMQNVTIVLFEAPIVGILRYKDGPLSSFLHNLVPKQQFWATGWKEHNKEPPPRCRYGAEDSSDGHNPQKSIYEHQNGDVLRNYIPCFYIVPTWTNIGNVHLTVFIYV